MKPKSNQANPANQSSPLNFTLPTMITRSSFDHHVFLQWSEGTTRYHTPRLKRCSHESNFPSVFSPLNCSPPCLHRLIHQSIHRLIRRVQSASIWICSLFNVPITEGPLAADCAPKLGSMSLRIRIRETAGCGWWLEVGTFFFVPVSNDAIDSRTTGGMAKAFWFQWPDRRWLQETLQWRYFNGSQGLRY